MTNSAEAAIGGVIPGTQTAVQKATSVAIGVRPRTLAVCFLAPVRNQMSRRGAHLMAEDLIFLRLVGKELPFPALLLHGAAGSLQCLLGGRLFTLLPFTQSTVAVPLLHAAGGRAPAGGLLHFAPAALAVVHLTAAVGRFQVWLVARGGQRSPRLAALPVRIKLLFALIVLIVTGQPVNGVVRIRSRHPQRQALASTDHH